MNAFKCDRCSKYFDGFGCHTLTRVVFFGKRRATVETNIILEYADNNNVERNAELCSTCIKALAKGEE